MNSAVELIRTNSMGLRKRVWGGVSALLLFGSPLVASADPPTTDFPTMTVVGERQGDGEAIVCSTGACFDSANEEALQSYLEWVEMYDTFPQEAVPMDGDRFCSLLAAKEPSGCSLGSPPPSPGIIVSGANWQPNGCGTPGTQWFQDSVLEVIASNSYSGNLDAPYPGISFLSACNAHDTCWAAGRERWYCDTQFQQSTQNACLAVSSSQGRSTCSGFASLYHGALSTTDASDDAYNASLADRSCALWALDMRENECDD